MSPYPAFQPCGTRARYAGGCRCPDCIEANRAYHREHRRPTGDPRVILPRFVTAPPMAWADHAACAGVHPDLFHPTRGEQSSPAKAICASCQVQTECLTWALQTRQQHGIWGGLSERERKRLATRP